MSIDYRNAGLKWTDLFRNLNSEELRAVGDALSEYMLIPYRRSPKAFDKLVCEFVPQEQFRAFVKHLDNSHFADEVDERISKLWYDWRGVEGIGVARWVFCEAEEAALGNEALNNAKDDDARDDIV